MAINSNREAGPSRQLFDQQLLPGARARGKKADRSAE